MYLDDRRDEPAVIFNLVKELFESKRNTICIHNAKFDMHHIWLWCWDNFKYDLQFNCKIIDTAMLARMANNIAMSVALEDVARAKGLWKSDAVKIWINKNNAYKMVEMEDGTFEKSPDYARVPYSIISEYAKIDARICYQLYGILLEDIGKLDLYLKTLNPPRSIWHNIDREAAFTKSLYRVEKQGVLTSVTDIQRNFENERLRAAQASERYTQITGRTFVDSNKSHSGACEALGIDTSSAKRTATGEVSFSKQNLTAVDSVISEPIKDYREANKKANTVLLGLLNARDYDGRIHTNFNQSTARTFRLSSSEPNLQNISKKEDLQGQNLKDLFIAEEDFYFCSFDWKAQEMRLLFDLCGEVSVAQRIIAGEDTHDVTSSLMGGVTRKQAKDIGFGLVYGMGIDLLAEKLKCSPQEARRLKELFLRSMPNAASFIKAVIRKAKETGFISNPWGRVFKFSVDDAYKAVNYLIQSSGAEILRDAMNELDKMYFGNPYVKMILTVHDEICFSIHKDHLHEIENIKHVMRTVYKHKILPMDVDCKISNESWGKCG